MMKRWIAAAALAGVLPAAPLAAQDSTAVAPPKELPDSAAVPVIRDFSPDARGPRVPFASPVLPAEHWAVRAAWRAEAMGLARFFPAQRAATRAEVYAALREAERRAPDGAARRMAAGWLARFTEEFAEFRRALPVSGTAAAGYQRDEGRLSPAVGYNPTLRQVPRALPDVDDPLAALSLTAALPHAAASVEGAYRGGEAVLNTWEVAAGAGAWQLSAGRAQVGYGFGRTGAIVLSDPDPLPRAELRTTRPVRLPSILRILGPTTFDLFGGPVNDPARHPTDPALWGMRVAIQPHPRLTLALNRTSLFGGEGRPATAGNLVKMFFGVVHSDFENQVGSLEARLRLPTERVLPATAYLEWGTDDAAGAITEVPARLFGVWLAALPGAPTVGLGVEHVRFADPCCGHAPWYYNATFPGNWAVRGRPLGHPLGGEGNETAAYAQADLFGARLRVDARGWIANRSDRSLATYAGGNLFTPTWTGRSHGGRVQAAWRLLPGLEARAEYEREDGSGWRAQHLQAAAAWFF